MKIIHNTSTTASFNLALEQVLMEDMADDVFMLWQNAHAVICGKNQNARGEVNQAYAVEHGIDVIRRLTGGGAVYHDLGNVNFTFITSAQEGMGLDFERFAAPVIKALNALGITAHLRGRNDIVADTPQGEVKISGNAQCIYGGRLLHHGTLLYDTDMGALSQVLMPGIDKLVSKGIKSVRSRVGNIRQIGALEMNTDEFVDYLFDYIKAEYNCDVHELSEEIIGRTRELAECRYATEQWNYGAYKEYSYSNKARFECGMMEVLLNVRDGKIGDFKLYGDFFELQNMSQLSELFEGCAFNKSDICVMLARNDIARYIKNATNEDLLSLL